MARGRSYSREFKLEVVRQVTNGEKRPAQVCREHGIAQGLLLHWRKQVEARGDAAFTATQPSELDRLRQRITELERFCGQLALENAVLKKASQTVPSRSATR